VQLFPERSHSHTAHRVAFFLHYGTIDPDLLVCHSCDFRICVNWSHLWQGTHADNTHDMMQKGRMNMGAHHWREAHPDLILRGETHPFAKVTMAQVRAMRARYVLGGISCKTLGSEYDLCANAVWKIVTGQTYKE
jgi:hypothetical protein